MNLYKLPLLKLSEYQTIVSALNTGALPCAAVGLSSVHKANFAAGIANDAGRQTLIITPDELAARRLCDDINEMTGGDTAALYPAKEYAFREDETVSGEYEQLRLNVLFGAATGRRRIVVSSADAAMQYTIPKTEIINRTVKVAPGMRIAMEKLLKKLEYAGYSRRPQVDSASQYSVRGGLIDVFPPSEKSPVRIEFWGDEIDTLSEFDLDTQRRTRSLDGIEIPPAAEVIFGSEDDAVKKLTALRDKLNDTPAAKRSREFIAKDIEKISSGIKLPSYDRYLFAAYEARATLLDYFDDPVVIISEYNDCKERAHGALARHNEDIKLLLDEGALSGENCEYYLEPHEFFAALFRKDTLIFESFARAMHDVRMKTLVNVNALQNSGWSGSLSSLCEELTPMLSLGYCCVVLSGTQKSASTLAQDLRREGIAADYVKDINELLPGRVYVVHGSVSAGFEYPDAKFSLITNTSTRAFKINRAKKRKGEEIKSLGDLSRGDLVVHVSHGIGVFDGINKLDLHGVKKDYIKIKYAGADTLYVPVTQLDLVSKYIYPQDDGRVKLNKLNSGEWQKTRSRVKAAVADMADELIKLYAARMQTKGFAFSPDDEWQKQFEEHFPYEETDDQLRCAEEIKKDMETPVPMDRLLCADVGFGKTEVALRGAFKCVMDSKQCAILCPTTILAWQHYQTAVKRMDGFPINVALLSRFRSPKQQRETLKGLKNGTVDIVIGIHRLVQKDVEFKSLGLAVIDEEQRFGVKHKEKFKEMFNGVDMLSLSATPIPRTLNMAMSGLRDMSTIDEAPQDRFPVQTYVIEYDSAIIAQALSLELRRGGQVYYIHNRIESIELCAAKLREMLPQARIGIAHGKMGEEELSQIWKQLLDHDIDILVCTTLIETGVDVPNCNTLIIEDADNMGLAQLYQLRGRVGRSNRRAYAYFTFRRGKVLTEIAAKRLSAIREFTKFGSGFRIALRDLEIRGAGSMLGAKQHGHMEAVGYDMYIKLLNEAVAKQKGETIEKQPEECLVDISMDAHIPESYISNSSQRLEVYRKIASIRSYEDSLDVTDELIDRFGEPPGAVNGLIEIALLKNSASMNSITEIKQQGREVIVKSGELNMDIVGALSESLGSRMRINAGEKPFIAVKMLKDDKTALGTIREILDIISKRENHTTNDE